MQRKMEQQPVRMFTTRNEIMCFMRIAEVLFDISC